MSNTQMNYLFQLRPYEFTVPDMVDMYDHMPYNCDVNLCNRETIAIESGNVIKSYRCNITNDYTIDNDDNVTMK